MGDTDGDIDYDWPDGASRYLIDSNRRKFNLYTFLSDIKNSSDVKVNCDDAANLFNLFTFALGLNSYSKIIKRPGTHETFQTNKINAIGDSGEHDWDIAHWNNHHYGWYVDSVYDACILVDSTNNILPVNMKQTDYDNYLIAPSPPAPPGNGYEISTIGDVSLQ